MRERQREFDWPRASQLRVLRCVRLSGLQVSEGGRQVAVSAGLAAAVLRAIDDRAGRAGWCTACGETLAAQIGVSRRSVCRALAALDAAGLVIGQRRRDGRGWLRARWRCHWPALAALADWGPAERAAVEAEIERAAAPPQAAAGEAGRGGGGAARRAARLAELLGGGRDAVALAERVAWGVERGRIAESVVESAAEAVRAQAGRLRSPVRYFSACVFRAGSVVSGG